MGVTSFAPGNDTTLFLSGDGYFFLFEKRLPREEHKPRRHPEYTGHLEHFRPLENGGFAMSVAGENKQVTKYILASSSCLCLRMCEHRVREHAAFSALAVIILIYSHVFLSSQDFQPKRVKFDFCEAQNRIAFMIISPGRAVGSNSCLYSALGYSVSGRLEKSHDLPNLRASLAIDRSQVNAFMSAAPISLLRSLKYCTFIFLSLCPR